jgi:UDP-N-acetylglucosamine transferase subunit ALG13
MILVTVGTHEQGFDRLVRAADELAAQIEERMVIQRGSSTFQPRHAESFPFASSEQMETLTCQARIVITHAAAGAIILGLRLGRPLVVVPRLKKLAEVFDNHQLQLARALEAQGRAAAVWDPSASALKLAIERAANQTKRLEGNQNLICAVRQQLSTWKASRRDWASQ